MNKISVIDFDNEKAGKISDTALLSRVFISVTVIIACLIAMGFSAYAYFSAGVSSYVSTISSASYDLVITPPDGVEKSETYELSEGEYIFTLSCVGSNSTASVGYCKILIKTDANDDDFQTFYTAPIWNSDGSDEKPNTRRVKITVPEGKSAVITFVSQWGSCSSDTVINEEITQIKFKEQ